MRTDHIKQKIQVDVAHRESTFLCGVYIIMYTEPEKSVCARLCDADSIKR